MAEHLIRGQVAEDAALSYLQNQGLKLVKRNHQCRFGEIDLIMKDREELVFVEVRFRSNNSHGGAIESISRKKRDRLQMTALHYLQSQALNPDSTLLRFDVIALSGNADAPQTEWIENALS